jgi:FO synthase
MEQARAAAPREVERALGRAGRGVALDVDEAAALLQARGDHLEALLALAGAVRDRGLQDAGRPGIVTYSRKVFIPLTRLCRDRCHYCTFATDPASLRRGGHGMYLSPDEVLEIARQGAALGCKEALFTLGDRPEDRWPAAREWLDAHGYDDTLSYVRAMAVRVLEDTGLLPHLNPGVMTWEELARLKPVAPSMGLMLEQSASRLWSEAGAVHFGSPDKDPSVRLRTITDAGRHAIPFTTGVLVGIGETWQERAQSILDIRRAAREHHHVQEVIVQNFRAKPDTAMRHEDDLALDEYLAAIAVARLLLGPRMRVQAPPNLTDPHEVHQLLRAGVDDWGGVSPLTPDHVNPERPWPHIDELERVTADAGFVLRERLTAHPEYVLRPEPWIDPRVRGHVAALAGPDGLAVEGRIPEGRPWQHAEGYAAFADASSGGRTDLAVSIDETGRSSDRRSDFDEVYGDWAAIGAHARQIGSVAPARLDSDVRAGLALAADDPAALARPEHAALAVALMSCDGDALDALTRLADDVRRSAVGDDVTYVVTRNLNFTNVCYTGCRFCAFAQRRTDADAFTLSLDEVGQRVAEAWDVGATEICMQGGIHPDLPGTAYFDLAREVKRRAPGVHLHAFSPMEVVNGATRSGMSVREWLQEAKASGLDSLPGTAAEILDDDVRWVLTKGKLPTAAWIDVVSTAHDVGLPTTSTMMYGHVDTPAHWVAHLALLRSVQERTGGFTEFVALPFIHHNAPVYLAGVARPGSTRRDDRAVHAMARLMLHGAIDHIQCSWVKLGTDDVVMLLEGGCDDIGGTLMEETISRMAGSQHGSRKTVAELEALAAAAGRPARQRTTLYGPVAAERLAAQQAAPDLLPLLPVVG